MKLNLMPGMFNLRTKRTSDSLTPRERTVLQMVETQGLSAKQIASTLGVSPATVAAHLRAARRAQAVATTARRWRVRRWLAAIATGLIAGAATLAVSAVIYWEFS